MKRYILITKLKNKAYVRNIHETYFYAHNPGYGVLFTSEESSYLLFVSLDLEPDHATFLALTLNAVVKPLDDMKVISSYLEQDINNFLASLSHEWKHISQFLVTRLMNTSYTCITPI